MDKREYKDCKYCGNPVVAPHDLNYHLSCKATDESISRALNLDVKDIRLATNIETQ